MAPPSTVRWWLAVVKEVVIRPYRKGNTMTIYLPDELVLDSAFPPELRKCEKLRVRVDGSGLRIEPACEESSVE